MRIHNNVKLSFVFHVILILTVLFASSQSVNFNKQRHTDSAVAKMNSITNTLAAITDKTLLEEIANVQTRGDQLQKSDAIYLRIANNFKVTLLGHGMTDCELSFVTAAASGSDFQRLVSTENIYKFGDNIADRSGLLAAHYTETAGDLIKVNEDIVKFAAHSPVFDRNYEVIGVIRMETGDRSVELAKASSLAWFWPWFMAYIFVAFIHLALMNRTIKVVKEERREMSVEHELNKKNQELKLLSLVAKKSDNLMIITDEEGFILWVNETFKEKNQFSAEELNKFKGKHLPELSKNANIQNIMKSVVDFKESISYETSSMDKKGSIKYALTTITPITNESGTVTNLLFVDSDITKLSIGQKMLEEMKSLIQLCPLPLASIDKDGNLCYYSPKGKELFYTLTSGDEQTDSELFSSIKAETQTSRTWIEMSSKNRIGAIQARYDEGSGHILITSTKFIEEYMPIRMLAS